MYSPTTRLLTVLELLQSYKQMSGSEIARRLEVDLRTVRRYIVTLQDMGIPVEAERGPYGAYQLARGYKLPPLMFTDGEGRELVLHPGKNGFNHVHDRKTGKPINVYADMKNINWTSGFNLQSGQWENRLWPKAGEKTLVCPAIDGAKARKAAPIAPRKIML